MYRIFDFDSEFWKTETGRLIAWEFGASLVWLKSAGNKLQQEIEEKAKKIRFIIIGYQIDWIKCLFGTRNCKCAKRKFLR